jgi:hypothetical protein
MSAAANAAKFLAAINGIPAKVIFKKHLGVKNVSATGDFTFDLPLKVNYHRMWLKCETSAPALLTEAQIETAISKVQLTVDGQVKVSASATVLNDVRNYEEGGNAGGSANGYLLVDLTKQLQLVQQSYLLRYGTADVDQMVLTVTVASTAALAKMTLFGDVDNEPNVPLGTHLKFQSVHNSDETSGIQEITSGLPFANRREVLRKLHIITTQCSQLNAEINGAVYHPDVPKTLNDEGLQMKNKTPISTWYSLDFSTDNDITAGLEMPFAEYRFQPTMDSATTGGYDVYFETIQQPAA